MHIPRFESRRAFLHQKSADLAVLAFGPDHRYIRQRPAGDPHLLAIQYVVIALLHRARQHPTRVRSELRLGQPKATDRLPLLQPRQPFFLLRVGTKRVDRIHHQRALDRNKTSQSGIAAFQFLRHQSVRDIAHSRATISVQVRTKKSQFAKLRHQVHRKSSFPAVFFDDGNDFVVDELSRGLPYQFFFVVQLRIKINKIYACKRGHPLFLFAPRRAPPLARSCVWVLGFSASVQRSAASVTRPFSTCHALQSAAACLSFEGPPRYAAAPSTTCPCSGRPSHPSVLRSSVPKNQHPSNDSPSFRGTLYLFSARPQGACDLLGLPPARHSRLGPPARNASSLTCPVRRPTPSASGGAT